MLSELRKRSGRTLRDLSRAVSSDRDDGSAHASYSTLGEWCRGDRLPQLTHLVAFERLLQELGVEDPAPWLEALARVRERSARSGEDVTPYLGLRSFRSADSAWFFGRSDVVDQLDDRFEAAAAGTAPRVVWVLGASGSGKSSLIHAGLVPRLEARGMVCASITPGEDPCERLVGYRAGVDTSTASHVLVVDQFEELFTAVDDGSERDRFAEDLAALATDQVVVCAVRADFFADITELPLLGRTVATSSVLARPMRLDELREAIVEPATRAGGTVDDELVEVLLRDLVPSTERSDHAPVGVLPLLSFALSETWRLRRRGRLTLADYLTVGGLAGAIGRAAEDAYTVLDDDEKLVAQQVFLRLVNLEGDTLTRRRVPVEDLAGLDGHELAPNDVLEIMAPFVIGRLLSVDDRGVSLTHEAVLRAWPRLKEWVDSCRTALAQHRTIAAATANWLELDRDPSALATGSRLAAMTEISRAAEPFVRLSRNEREFLDASQARADAVAADERRRARRLRATTAIALCLAVVAGLLSIVVNESRADAVAARKDALSRQIAATAESLAGKDLSLAQQLAVSAYEVAPTAEARAALLDLAANPQPSRYLGGAGSTAVAIAPSGEWFALTDNLDATVQLFVQADAGYERAGVIDFAEEGVESYAVAITPDETTLAVGDTTATIGLWDVSDLDEPELVATVDGPQGPVQRIAIHPDGHTMVAVGATELWQAEPSDGPATVDAVLRWDISDPSDPAVLEALQLPTAVTWTATYDRDGSRLVVGDDDGNATVWQTGEEPALLETITTGSSPVVAVDIFDDLVATGTRGAELGIWDVGGGSASAVDIAPPDFTTWVNTVGFAPDGNRFVAAGSDGYVQVWNTETWEHVTQLPHPDPITQGAFSDDGVLLTGSVDGAARLWNVENGLAERMIGIVGDVSYSSDGSRLAALSGWDAAVWEPADDGTLERIFYEPADDLSIGSGSLSPDGRFLAWGTIDGLVRLFDLDDPAPAAMDLPNGSAAGMVQSANFSFDNQILAAGGEDAQVRLWDMSDPSDPELVATIDEPDQIVLQTTWSPVDHTLVVSTAAGPVFVFDASDPSEPQLLSTIDVLASEAYTAAFTPDGDTLAVAGTEADVWLLDMSDPTDPTPIGDPITAPSSRIYDVGFDGHGHRLAAALTDGTVWVWDTDDVSAPEHVATLGPRSDALFTVEFDPRDDRLTASGIDPVVARWDLDVERAIESVCRTAGESITEQEWMAHLPSESYDPPCVD